MLHIQPDTAVNLCGWMWWVNRKNAFHAGIFAERNEILESDPNSNVISLLKRYGLLHTSMGHLVTKHKQMDLSSLPQGHFYSTEEVPGQYPSQVEGIVGEIQARRNNSEISISMEWETSRQASEHQNSRQHCQRKSIYSTVDRVPHVEFYINSVGRQQSSRPSLELLRKVSEVSNLLVTSLIWSSLIEPLNPQDPVIDPDLHFICYTTLYTTE